MSSFSMIRRVALAGLLAAGAAGPAMASGDGSDSSEETTPSETTPSETTPSGTMQPVPAPPSPQSELDAARARCHDVSERADLLANMGGPLYKSGEIDRLRAQA